MRASVCTGHNLQKIIYCKWAVCKLDFKNIRHCSDERTEKWRQKSWKTAYTIDNRQTSPMSLYCLFMRWGLMGLIRTDWHADNCISTQLQFHSKTPPGLPYAYHLSVLPELLSKLPHPTTTQTCTHITGRVIFLTAVVFPPPPVWRRGIWTTWHNANDVFYEYI